MDKRFICGNRIGSGKKVFMFCVVSLLRELYLISLIHNHFLTEIVDRYFKMLIIKGIIKSFSIVSTLSITKMNFLKSDLFESNYSGLNN